MNGATSRNIKYSMKDIRFFTFIYHRLMSSFKRSIDTPEFAFRFLHCTFIRKYFDVDLPKSCETSFTCKINSVAITISLKYVFWQSLAQIFFSEKKILFLKIDLRLNIYNVKFAQPMTPLNIL